MGRAVLPHDRCLRRILRSIRQHLQTIAQAHHQTLVSLAMAWVFNTAGITGAMMGICAEQEARSRVDSASWKLTAQEVQAIDHVLANWP